MGTLSRLLVNVLKLIGVQFKILVMWIFDYIEGSIEPKKLVKSEVKEAEVRQLLRVENGFFNSGLEDEYLYSTETKWSRDIEEYEEPIGI